MATTCSIVNSTRFCLGEVEYFVKYISKPVDTVKKLNDSTKFKSNCLRLYLASGCAISRCIKTNWPVNLSHFHVYNKNDILLDGYAFHTYFFIFCMNS